MVFSKASKWNNKVSPTHWIKLWLYNSARSLYKGINSFNYVLIYHTILKIGFIWMLTTHQVIRCFILLSFVKIKINFLSLLNFTRRVYFHSRYYLIVIFIHRVWILKRENSRVQVEPWKYKYILNLFELKYSPGREYFCNVLVYNIINAYA
jgi:hypothetical protein